MSMFDMFLFNVGNCDIEAATFLVQDNEDRPSLKTKTKWLCIALLGMTVAAVLISLLGFTVGIKTELANEDETKCTSDKLCFYPP